MSKSDKKPRPCLGTDCDAVIVTTPEKRLCETCRKALVQSARIMPARYSAAGHDHGARRVIVKGAHE